MISNQFPSGKRFESPPKVAPKIDARPSCEAALHVDAQVKEKTGFGWAKVALGLGLSAGALSGCTDPVPPAAEAGAYALESPDVVVMDASLDRIDLARETDTVCSGFDEDETCWEEDVDYHRVGLHVGHGVVQDLNGNLFVAPQLVAKGAPGHAVLNPDRATVKAPLWSEGRLNQTESGEFETEGILFGRHTITVRGKEAVVESPSLFGSYESMRVRNDGGFVTIVESGWDQEIVQSQGDHLLIQTQWGGRLGEVRQDQGAGSYSLRRDGAFNDLTYQVTYSPGEYRRSSDGWGSSELVARRDGDTTTSGFESFLSGSYTSQSTESGWTTRSGALSGTTEYIINGGEVVGR